MPVMIIVSLLASRAASLVWAIRPCLSCSCCFQTHVAVQLCSQFRCREGSH